MIIQTRYGIIDRDNLKFRLVIDNYLIKDNKKFMLFDSKRHTIITEVTYV